MDEQKRDFLADFQAEGANRSEVCRRWGISRKHAYALLHRVEQEGAAGLHARSRRPHRSPTRTPAELEAEVLAVRHAHPGGGGRKIAWTLQQAGRAAVPAPSTITAILRRHGLLSPPVQARAAMVRFERAAANELWQMDFKGDVRLRAGERCHPLLILDDHSRYCIAVQALPDQQGEGVRTVLETSFRGCGLPEAMLMDNGSPWGDDAVHVHTPLGVWLLSLGVRVLHGRPYHPQTQGKLERLNRTLDVEVLGAGTAMGTLLREQRAERTAVQGAFDAWRPLYNEQRPHEALGMQVPASRWQPSPRPYPERPPPIEYEAEDEVRRVQQHGRVSYRGREYRLPKAFRGWPVALRRTDQESERAVYFGPQRIAVLDLGAGTTQLVRGGQEDDE